MARLLAKTQTLMRGGGSAGRRRAAAAVVALVVGAGTAAVPSAGAVTQPGGPLPSEVPSNATPQVLDGEVNAIARVGDTVVLGGNFTQARNSDTQTAMTRNRLLAFDAATGRISTTFVPNANGPVDAVVPAGDGTSVYVGGSFTSIGGVARSRVARVRISDGAVLTSFNAGTINARVRDLRLVGGRLWIGGAFSTVRGTAQPGLATVDAATGAFDPYMRLQVGGVHNGGSTSVSKIDVTPDGSRLVAIGNFRTLNGVVNDQLFMLDLTGAAAAPANWRTSVYGASCARVFNTYLRDVDFSPDGSYFVVTTTGAYLGASRPCDTVARFETGATGNDVTWSWIDHSGGDTSYAAEVTDHAIYIGGHQRWWNNPNAGDRAGAGAVAREGIAALDPVNGLPLSWNPGRARGVGVFDFLVSTNGVYFGSDTVRVNGYLRSRIALMPFAGGTSFPSISNPELPGEVHLAGQNGASNLTGRTLDAADNVGPSQPEATGGINWNDVRGAFVIDDELYLAQSDGTFTKRSYDGTSFGTAQQVNTQDQVVALTAWRSDIQNATGMFYDGGRIYFTLNGSDQLYYRYFTPESGVVGAVRYVASGNVSGIDFAQVRGMFGTGDRLYWASASGALNRIDWEPPTPNRGSSGRPVAGTAAVVSTAAQAGGTWASRALFLTETGTTTPPENQAPTASFTFSCDGLACSFDAGASDDPDGDALTYAWSFGDGTQGTGETTSRTYGSAGTRTVTLTVSDGTASTSTTRSVTASQPPTGTGEVTFVGSAETAGNRNNHRVQVPSSVQPGDTLLMFLVNNNATAAATTPAGWTLLEQSTAAVSGRLYSRQATAADSGSTVTVTTDVFTKSTLSLTAYRGDGGTSVTASEIAGSAGGTSFATPTVPVTTAGSWYVGGWAEKSADATTWTVPGTVTRRSTAEATGGGKVSTVVADSGATVGTGTAGGTTATTNHTVNRAVTFSAVVAPGGGGGPQEPEEPEEPEAGDVTFVGSAETAGNRSAHRVELPATVQAGDTLLLFLSNNTAGATATTPAGWTLLEESTGGASGRLYTRQATAADAGSTVTVSTDVFTKSTLTVTAYRAEGGSTVAASEIAGADGGTAATTPSVPVARTGSWYVGAWAEKSADATTWTVPGTLTRRSTAEATGGGKVSTVVADSAGPVGTGTAGGTTATTNHDVNRVVTFSVVVAPAP